VKVLNKTLAQARVLTKSKEGSKKKVLMKGCFLLSLQYLRINMLFIQGWINSVRKHKHNTFVDLNDGSSIHSLQLVIEPAMFER